MQCSKPSGFPDLHTSRSPDSVFVLEATTGEILRRKYSARLDKPYRRRDHQSCFLRLDGLYSSTGYRFFVPCRYILRIIFGNSETYTRNRY